MWSKLFELFDDEGEDQVESEEKQEDEERHPFKTCPFDPRFPHTNQTKHCFVSFIDFQRCSRLLGNYEGCEQLELCYRSMCPNEWVAKWEEQLEEGTFPVKLPPKREDVEDQNEEAEDEEDQKEEAEAEEGEAEDDQNEAAVDEPGEAEGAQGQVNDQDVE